jgi:hypothetical protein
MRLEFYEAMYRENKIGIKRRSMFNGKTEFLTEPIGTVPLTYGVSVRSLGAAPD